MTFSTNSAEIEQWDIFELALQGSAEGNPFLDVELSASFSYRHRTVEVEGFYDGDGVYRLRFMPDVPGEWRFRTRSNRDELSGAWDRFFRIVQESDPYGHLRSIHNGHVMYDHSQPWVTHQSIQRRDLSQVKLWHEQHRKPVVVDECCYEGDIWQFWGNISAQELVHRFWLGTANGGYGGHGETYEHAEDILWWAKGGVLHGESAPRRSRPDLRPRVMISSASLPE